MSSIGHRSGEKIMREKKHPCWARLAGCLRAMSHKAIYRQPFPGNHLHVQATISRQPFTCTGNHFQAISKKKSTSDIGWQITHMLPKWFCSLYVLHNSAGNLHCTLSECFMTPSFKLNWLVENKDCLTQHFFVLLVY